MDEATLTIKVITMLWYIILTVFVRYIMYKWIKEYCSPLYDIPEPPRYGNFKTPSILYENSR